jgi:hypothetical protein
MLLVTKHNYLSFMIVEMSFFIHVENSHDFHPSNEGLWNDWAKWEPTMIHHVTVKNCQYFKNCVILLPFIHNFTQDQSTRPYEFISVPFFLKHQYFFTWVKGMFLVYLVVSAHWKKFKLCKLLAWFIHHGG